MKKLYVAIPSFGDNGRPFKARKTREKAEIDADLIKHIYPNLEEWPYTNVKVIEIEVEDDE